MKGIRTTRPLALLLLPLLLVSCNTVPFTGRSQTLLYGSAEINKMSFTAYQEFLGKHKLSANAAQTQMVKRVGDRIRRAVEKALVKPQDRKRLEGFQWEFNLVESTEVNAWCMPGGKVVVYTGMLPVAQDETGLAVVVGHEVAHAIAHHGNERMSDNLFVAVGAVALNEALAEKPEETRNLFLTLYGVTASVGFLLPYSRVHESEADHMGVIFMAMAGYDPREAPKFWQRMAERAGKSGPDWFSTHPSHETRIADLKKHSLEAMKYYRPAKP